LARLTKALVEFPDKDVADAIRLLLLSGARKNEVLTMKWEHLDLTAGTWKKPASMSKTKKRIHDLRHSFASELVSAGYSLPLIGSLLGHRNPATTARYSHLYRDARREAVERVGAAVTNAGKEAPEPTPLRRGR
jgi:integrase